MATKAKPCTFCQIAGGDEPAAMVHRDDDVVAFLDRRPLFHGHVLLIPRRHVVTLGELPHTGIEPLFAMAQRLSLAVPAAMEAAGTFMAINNVVSQSVSHLHLHVVPRRKGDGLRGFFWPRTTYDNDEQMQAIARRITLALKSLAP
jgi:histidine triad (HIT) family protein